MKTTELERVIRDFIRDFYKIEYIDKLTIEPLNPGYSIKMSLGVENKPLVICGVMEDEQFLKFLKNELINRNFHLREYGKLDLRYPYNPCNYKSRPCCEKR